MTLFLTMSQPLPAFELEKLWDAEQQHQFPQVIGRPQLRVQAHSPYVFELVVADQEQVLLSPEKACQLLSGALRRNYPHCQLDWGRPSEPIAAPRKPAGSEPGGSSPHRRIEGQ